MPGKKIIEIRGHHITFLFSYRESHSERMERKVSRLQNKLENSNDILICVTDSPDYICKNTCPCYLKECSGNHPKQVDKSWTRLLGVNIGKNYAPSDLMKKVYQREVLLAITEQIKKNYLKENRL